MFVHNRKFNPQLKLPLVRLPEIDSIRSRSKQGNPMRKYAAVLIPVLITAGYAHAAEPVSRMTMSSPYVTWAEENQGGKETYTAFMSGISALGGKVERINKDNSTFTVSGSPEILTEVERFVSFHNGYATTQISVKIRVVDFTPKDDASRNIVRAMPLSSPSEIPLSTLSGLGRVSLNTTTSVTTLNGISAPVQIANTRGYPVLITITDADGKNPRPADRLSPGTVTTGISMDFKPVVDAGNVMRIRYSMTWSELTGDVNGFNTFKTSGRDVQLPNVTSQRINDIVTVKPGGSIFFRTDNASDGTSVFVEMTPVIIPPVNREPLSHPTAANSGGSL